MIPPLPALLVVFAATALSPSATEFDLALRDFDEAQQSQRTQPDRARQLFRSAAQRLSSVAASGLRSGYLEYNLGNCHLQAGDLGQAILHYRRAQLLIPRDPLLADNLTLARSRCLTQIQPARQDVVLRGVFFWHYQTSSGERAYAAGGAYGLTFVLLIARAFVRRRSLLIVSAVSAAAAAVGGVSLLADRWTERNEPGAVITQMDVPVYKGPGPGYQRQFEQPLQPGVECVVLERRDRWWRVQLADGNRGWVEGAAAELVNEEPGEAAVILRS
jgi:hypothetical protein